MMCRFVLAVAPYALAGCAVSTSVVTLKLPVAIVDHPAERRIDVQYENETGQMLCLAAEDWPNSSGDLHEAGEKVFLLVREERFAIREFNAGYCFGDSSCTLRIAPGDRLSAAIPYENFGLPEAQVNAPKTLEYSPTAHVCRKGR
jgi:hypothetical protein